QNTVLQVHLKAEKKIFEHSTSDKDYNAKGCFSQTSKDWFIRVNED
ncbi:9072_t:CDS:2, partial [Gigaspora margarita]